MPRWKELKRYVDNDGWELYKVTDHYYYRKLMPDGRLLKTKISFNPGEIPKYLFQEILKNQLQISKEEFNKKI